MDFIKIGSLSIAFVITLFLIACHYFSPLINQIPYINSKKLTSFAAGMSVAYVFLYMLPELVEGNETIGKVLSQTKVLTPLLDLGIFIVALLGFNIYFGLEILANNEQTKQSSSTQKVYYLHLLMYGIYNFLITYTMPLRVQSGMMYAFIFFLVMGSHFVFIDLNFNKNFSQYFLLSGRIFLLLALFLGWLVTALTDPINVTLVTFMIAFLSGSVLYNVFREELGGYKNSNFGSFTLGIILLSVILILMAVYKA